MQTCGAQGPVGASPAIMSQFSVASHYALLSLTSHVGAVVFLPQLFSDGEPANLCRAYCCWPCLKILRLLSHPVRSPGALL